MFKKAGKREKMYCKPFSIMKNKLNTFRMISRVLVRGGCRMQSVKTTKGEKSSPLSWPAKVTGGVRDIKYVPEIFLIY